MALVGLYDASTFVEGNYATYPQLPSGVVYYQPSMWWQVTVAGTVHGQPVVAGDLLFATQGAGRLFGDGLWGDQIFGGTSDGDWTVQQVQFLKWDATVAPPDQIPYPNAGCPFTQDWQPFGDWAPGWRIVVDAFYSSLLGSRTYGEDTYGDAVYGDASGLGTPGWTDITRPSFHIEAGDGTTNGSSRVPVAEVVVDFIDEFGGWFDIAEPATWHQPQPGTPLRVGFLDPEFRYWPVFVGELERVEDVHDGDHPRIVTIRGFGQIMDLTVDLPGVKRPAEMATTRYKDLVTAAGWSWDNGLVEFPPGDGLLVADAEPRDIVARDELDRTVQSCGWFLDSDRQGRMRVRPWPHEPAGDPFVVVDCPIDDPATYVADRSLESGVPRITEAGVSRAFEAPFAGDTGWPLDPDALVAYSITFANDESQLLNYVMTTNTGDPNFVADPDPKSVALADELSVSRFGRRGRALGYPQTAMAWAFTDVATIWLRRVLNRYAWITRHVESFEADTAVDPGWLELLAGLDTGRPVVVERRALARLELDAVVVGWRHRIDPGRWASTVFTATTTSSM